MNRLRELFPVHLVYGGFVRSDHAGVGVVVGGTPVWDLVSDAIRNECGRQYHQMLLTLDHPLHIYITTESVDLSDPIMRFLHVQAQVTHPAQARILGEFADSLTDTTQHDGSQDGGQMLHGVPRLTQVLWELPVLPSAVPALPWRSGSSGTRDQRREAVMRSAVQRARSWVDLLARLGGSPQARLMSSQELMARFYVTADPERSRLFPLAGSVAERVRPVIESIAWLDAIDPPETEEVA
jgi:hypothetical protein